MSREWAGRAAPTITITHVRKQEGSCKEGKAEQGKGGLGCPEKGEHSFKRGCWISPLEKVRCELRLEGAQGVRLALPRGKLSPTEGVSQAGAPRHAGKTGGPGDWAKGRVGRR